jgi:hypothetical protein
MLLKILMKTDDGSVIQDGKVIFFSYERFVRDIVQGNRCFMCGANPELVTFNDEHVLPDWILRRFGLHNRVITLPNQTQFRYGQFKMPCCKSCNSMLGEKVEKPISELFGKGFDGFAEQLKSEGTHFLFRWMCLLFLKTHLKDTGLVMHLDQRKGRQKIGELHSWSEMHHIHCVARSFYTNGIVRPEAFGSLMVLPAKTLPYHESFDYCDLSFAQTMLLRIGEIAVISVFDDAKGCLSVIDDFLRKIRGPLSPLQLREVATHVAAINLHLAERPRFSSEINVMTGQYVIGAETAETVELTEWKSEILGQMMHSICGNAMPEFDGKAEILEGLKTGRSTFLHNDKGEFAADHMDPIADGSVKSDADSI